MSSVEKKELGENSYAADASALLNYYFELGDTHADALVEEWLTRYPAPWIRLAIIESLYQGRYRSVSVSQILEVWQRRHQVLQHFNYDFECLVTNNLPGKTNPNASTALDSPPPVEGTTAATSWADEEGATPHTISQFTPETDRSEFYARLQALAQQVREKQEREIVKEVSEPTPDEDRILTQEDTMNDSISEQ